MAKYLIREIAVDPPVPDDLVVFRREDIAAFVAAARQQVDRLTAELEAERQRWFSARVPEVDDDGPDAVVVDISTAEPVGERWTYRREPDPPPPWFAHPSDRDNNVRFFESLRDEDTGLIAHAE